jgi:NitT/TauT family transport system permease protein
LAIDSSVAVATPGRRSLGQAIRFVATSPIVRGLALPLVLLGLWQVAASRHLVSSTFLPPPADVARAWWTWAFGARSPLSWTSGTFFEYSWLSARRVLIGFAIGSAVGVPVGVLIGYVRLVSDVLDPTIQAMRPVPQTAWLPFAVLVFGIQEKAAIFLIALGCFFPIVLNAAAGARQTPTLLVRAALMLGTSRLKILRRVVIPNALPSIFTGLRLGLGLAWVLVIVAEMLAVRGGLGFAIWSSYTFIRMDLIFAAIIAFGVYGWFSDRLLVLVGAHLMRWQHGLVKD